MVGPFVDDAIAESRRRLDDARPAGCRGRAPARPAASSACRRPDGEDSRAVKAFLTEHMYRHPRLTRVRDQAFAIVIDLASHFVAAPQDLPPPGLWRDARCGTGPDADRRRLRRRIDRSRRHRGASPAVRPRRRTCDRSSGMRLGRLIGPEHIMDIFADFHDRIAAILQAMVARGKLPAGTADRQVRGRAAARCRQRRPRHQRRHGARQGGQGRLRQPPGLRGGDRGRSRVGSGCRDGGGRRARLHQYRAAARSFIRP